MNLFGSDSPLLVAKCFWGFALATPQQAAVHFIKIILVNKALNVMKDWDQGSSCYSETTSFIC